MPNSLTLTCCLPCNTVIVSPSDIFMTLAEKAKRGQAIIKTAKNLVIGDRDLSLNFST